MLLEFRDNQQLFGNTLINLRSYNDLK
jgi:hypothetical protein